MDEATRKRYFSIGSNGDMGIAFPEPKKPADEHDFKVGDTIIVTTACEEMGLQGLTGEITCLANTGSIYVRLDADSSTIPFRPHELGHCF